MTRQSEILADGDRVGRYRVLRLAGKGGMGAVYEAMDEGLGRRVALKVLHARYATDALMLRRFFKEARAANLPEHPGIVQITDAGILPCGRAYLAMEFLSGTTLSAMMRRSGRLTEAQLRVMGTQVAAALEAAHERGIVHRDLKPANIMLLHDPAMPDGLRVKVVDFGIARLIPADEELTETGVLLGTAFYMAPEQCKNSKQVDPKADVYALGALIFHAVTGTPPFVGGSDLTILTQHIHATPPPLRSGAPAVSESLELLVQRMLAKDPALRPSMAEVRRALEERQAEGGAAWAHAAASAPDEAPSSAETEQRAGRAPRRRRWQVLCGAGALAAFMGLMAWRALSARTEPASPQESQAPPPPSRQQLVLPPRLRAGPPSPHRRSKEGRSRRLQQAEGPQAEGQQAASSLPPTGPDTHATPLID